MRQAECTVLATGILSSGHGFLELDCSPLGQPGRAGQFLMVRAPGEPAGMLRHPAFFSRGGNRAQLLIPPVDPLHLPLSALLPQSSLDVLGPLGQPYLLSAGARRLLLLAFAEPVAPIVAISHWAEWQGVATAVIIGGEQWQPLVSLLPESAECGVAGLNSSALEQALLWADQVVASLPPALFGALAALTSRLRLRLAPGFVKVIVARDYLCGLGACGSCALPVPGQHLLSCRDGPLFDLRELL